jgi:hypothetical protein
MNRFRPFSASRGLTIARLIVLGWMILSFLTLIVLLPVKFQSLRELEPGSVSQTAFYGWTTEQVHHLALTQGLSPELIGGIMFAASITCLLCYWSIGVLLFWRRSNTWAGLLVAFILFAIGPGFSNLHLTGAPTPVWLNTLYQLMAIFTWPTFFVMLYLFPNGKFVPRFTRSLAVLPYFLSLIGRIFPRLDAIGIYLLIPYAIGGLVSQIYRYRQVSTPEERQQTKWVVFGLGIFISVLILPFILPALIPNLASKTLVGFWGEFIGNGVVGILAPAVLPLAIGASILRYRLWDIDVIVRRTLQYSLVTGVLALVFFGSVTLLQAIFSAISGEQSSLAVALSTLAIAALFNPLRKRVQSFIDRRFYRQKYNSEQALAEFAATARNETDLGQLSEDLISTIQETLQPGKTSLWLKPVAVSGETLGNQQRNPE